MLIPEIDEAEALLLEAGRRNPGPWTAHSRNVAEAAQADRRATFPAWTRKRRTCMGLLHDIGRREGVTGMRHVLDGYRYLAAASATRMRHGSA